MLNKQEREEKAYAVALTPALAAEIDISFSV